jgi:hypothetical protein
LPEYKIIEADQDLYRKWVTPDLIDFSGGVFYNPDFLLTASQILDLNFDPLLCIDSEKLAGLANLITGKKYGVKTALIPPYFQYYGPVSLRGDEDVFHKLIQQINNKYDTAIFSLIPEFTSKSIPQNWQAKKRLTYYLKPDDFETMKTGSVHSARKQVNKSINAGVEFKSENKFQPDIYLASYKRQKIKPPLDIRLLTEWVNKLIELKLVEVYAACVEGRPAAFRAQLIFGRYACDWLAGCYPEYLNLGVNNFLILKIGDCLREKGIINWDLLGGDIESIGNFKKSFGSMPVQHFQIERNFSCKGRIYRMLMKTKAELYG